MSTNDGMTLADIDSLARTFTAGLHCFVAARNRVCALSRDKFALMSDYARALRFTDARATRKRRIDRPANTTRADGWTGRYVSRGKRNAIARANTDR